MKTVETMNRKRLTIPTYSAARFFDSPLYVLEIHEHAGQFKELWFLLA